VLTSTDNPSLRWIISKNASELLNMTKSLPYSKKLHFCNHSIALHKIKTIPSKVKMASVIALNEVEGLVLKLWERDNIIDRIAAACESRKEVVQLDGPPFATGTMHFGHIVVSTNKDINARIQTMTGSKVIRSYGYDTHGIPIEHLAKKKIGYNTTDQLIEFGVDKHNQICRDLINECCDAWKTSFAKIGRWIDPKKEYKTMDLSYMESVIWVFAKLYEKGLIYEGYKVMPYSVGCGTTLSNFEAKQAYRDVVDRTLSAKFELKTVPANSKLVLGEKSTYVIAWTTTPWTLPSNMALCTAPTGVLIKCTDSANNCYVIMSESKYATLDATKYPLVEKLSTQDVIGATYVSLYSNTQHQNSCPIVADAYVKMEGDAAGTGFVHIAPAYGEDDFRVGCEHELIDKNSRGKSSILDPIGPDGKFDQTFSQFAGLTFEESNKVIIKDLTSRSLVFDIKDYKHSYPFCDRSGCRLIYRVDTAWFVAASNPELKQRMMEFNDQINWAPSTVGSGQFKAWLEEPVDWCISRNRFWGTPLPVWKSADGEEVVCVSSKAELEKLTGGKISDLHIEFVDKLEIPSRMGKGMLKRVPFVLDCWFESGSAAVAECHYPFENREAFDARLKTGAPIVDFITESIDQCRGWFYVQLVLMTALFDRAPFANVIVTGIMLASDGQKMSKSKANYEDPTELIKAYGADVLRLYLLDTPILKATSVKFDDKALFKMQQSSTVKIYNMTKFLLEKCEFAARKGYPISMPTSADVKTFSNILDRWILNKCGLLATKMETDMLAYKYTNLSTCILEFTEQLTNWYVKMARERLKACDQQSLQTLMYVLMQFCMILAPIMPFISEFVYQEIKTFGMSANSMKIQSVHAESYPTEADFISDPSLETKFDLIQRIIVLIRDLRISVSVNNKFPLKLVEIGFIDSKLWDQISDVLDYVYAESSVVEIVRMPDCSSLLQMKLEPLRMELGRHLKGLNLANLMNEVTKFITEMPSDEIVTFMNTGKTTLTTSKGNTIELTWPMVKLNYCLLVKTPSVKNSNDIVMRIDASKTPDIMIKYMSKLIGQAIQMHRKQRCMKPWNVINLTYTSSDTSILEFMEANAHTFVCENMLSVKYVPIIADDKTTTHAIETGGNISFASDF
jgi:isoleucyl-tRNA synthetase